MAIASGTCGTCSWTISDAGVLTIGAGTLHAPWLTGIMGNNWPWSGHVKDIKSCVIASGVIVGTQEALMGGYTNEYSTAHMFYGCSNMASITFQGTFNTSNATDMSWMFDGCTSLTSLNLSTFNTAKVKNMSYLFSGCTLLTSITFGANFDTSTLDGSSGTSFLGSGFYSAVNNTNGLVINSDAAFRALLASEKTGTWVRQPSSVTYTVSAVRTYNGAVDEDGEDVTITATWLTGASTATRTLSVYKKLASESAYPSSAEATETLSGNSGTTSLTLSALGDDAYDFRVEFYDGTNKYIAFPSVASNVRLVTIDEDGCVEVMGNPNNCGWVFQRDYAAIRKIGKILNTSMYPFLDVLTQLGDWAMATYGENLWFSYISNENYESETNTQSGYVRINSNGSFAPSGKYMSGANALFAQATLSADNKSIAKSSTTSFTFSIAKTGYTPIAIRGFDLDNASSSGANVANCVVLAAKIKDASTAEFQIRNNNSSSAAKIKAILYVTYIATAAL